MKVTNVNKAVRRSGTRIALASAFAMGVLGLVGAGVYAGLNATATGTQTVTSGTLSLVVTTEAGAGFGQTFSNMAPGDVHNSYVTLTNGATLAAQNLTLAVSPGTANELSSAAKGLTVTVTGCTVAWTLPAVCRARLYSWPPPQLRLSRRLPPPSDRAPSQRRLCTTYRSASPCRIRTRRRSTELHPRLPSKG
jgi:hypothetical protein